MSGYTQLPEESEMTEIVVKVLISHDKIDKESEEYIWSDPAVDIVREVKKSLLRHNYVRHVDVQIIGNVGQLSANFNDL